MRIRFVCCLVVIFLLQPLVTRHSALLLCQSTDAAVGGQITDEQGRVVPGVKVVLTNLNTGVTYEAKTNGEGFYSAPNLPPGIYRENVSKDGFKSIVKGDIELHVQDVASINFQLHIGSMTETVTVEAGAPLLNTTDGSLSTIVDRNFVANMPLNGRTFQGLILLTPGAVTNPPQVQGLIGQSGEFSVNGQRTESNYYTVDGVSGNIGVSPTGSPATPNTGGTLSGATALGTTQALVSVDALQEFRVQSSTYSAEYGRSPGGQISMLSRSGTNDWHGSAFDYLRNDYFDANDWFNNYGGLPKPALRQNDFGGTLGGAIRIPHVYDGKDKTFFFFSYEGLRLLQPQEATTGYVPDSYLRTCTSGALQQVMNAFPQPTMAAGPPDCTNPDPGNGQSQFISTWSNPSQIDATSVRLDHNINSKLRIFFRFSDTPSFSNTRAARTASQVITNSFGTRTYTGGLTSTLSNRITNEFRANYSSNEGKVSYQLDGFGGAQPVDLAKLQGIDTANYPTYQVVLDLAFGESPSIRQLTGRGLQRQWNFVDTVGLTAGRHQFKFGVDYRRLTPALTPSNPAIQYLFFSESSVTANTPFPFSDSQSQAATYPLYTNFSAFAQDEWRMSPRLSISLGLRWEINPPPGVTQGFAPYTTQGSSLSTLTLAPQGTSLYATALHNFAPRLGAAYILRNTPGHETVLRGGVGVFYDTGQQLGSAGFDGPGFTKVQYGVPGASYGIPAGAVFSFPYSGWATPQPITQPALGSQVFNMYSYAANLQLPYTIQTNLTVEQSLGTAQALKISYVGGFARKLLAFNQVNPDFTVNPNFHTLTFIQNGLSSDYNALQLQFERRLSAGLQVLASYTFSHTIDYGSQDYRFPATRGNADFDVRHNVSAALSYDLPRAFHNPIASALFHHWGIDSRVSVRSGFPVTLLGSNVTNIDPATNQTVYAGLDLVPNQPIYLYGSNCATTLQNLPQPELAPGQGCPGGRGINPNAFCDPSVSTCSGSTAPRNFVRGFGAWQADLAVRREFPIHERLRLQFRAEAFNLFNHANFGYIDNMYGDATFGLTTQTLAQSLGVLSGLYQTGGPRSMQFALKLVF